MSVWRLTAAILLVASAVAIARTEREPVATVPAVLNVPYTLASWEGTDAEPLDAETQQAIQADVILNRTYTDPDGAATGLYIAYYARQRPGVSIHSPLHCLPGTGWDILTNQTVPVNIAGTTGAVRRLVARKDTSRVIVLYWYAIQGRMIASDLASRLQLFSDRVRLGRNDATLVRLVIPVTGSEAAAESRGIAFIGALLPHL